MLPLKAPPVAPEILERVSMGEGHTPLIEAGPDLPGVLVKLEYVMPTGSFKDRGAAVLIAAALARGAQRVVADSSGNAGAAIAAYAARAGLPCRVFVPARTSERKRAQMAAYGATVEVVDGDRGAAADAAASAVTATGAFYASHVLDPHFLVGMRSFAHELRETAPDALVLPVGNGTLLLGAALGFDELLRAGAIAQLPTLIAVQSERVAPLARAFDAGADEPVEVAASDTAAEGIAIPRPLRGSQVLAAVRRSGGCFLTIPEESIEPARADLAHRGVFVEPTAALTWAGLLIAREREIARGRVVVPACGSGLKG